MHIKKGDTITVISGSDKGKKGTILRVYPKTEQVLVEGVNMKTKHQRARQSNKKGQTVSIPHPVHASNVRKAESVKKSKKK